jgi:hypothetical protein
VPARDAGEPRPWGRGWIVGLVIAAFVAVRAVDRQIAFASGGIGRGCGPGEKDPSVIEEMRGGERSPTATCLHLGQPKPLTGMMFREADFV